jgi:hypothetical protein
MTIVNVSEEFIFMCSFIAGVGQLLRNCLERNFEIDFTKFLSDLQIQKFAF